MGSRMPKQEFIDRLITELDLKPLEFEGGLFAQTYKSSEVIPLPALPARYHSPRTYGTAILYLLLDHPDSFSAMHRLLTRSRCCCFTRMAAASR
jgi:predicted cupin superfamily sugar epimerase